MRRFVNQGAPNKSGIGQDGIPESVGICDASGFKFPLNELVRQWDGAYVHYSFCDRQNPQDFVRGVRDDQSLPISRPESPDVFVDPMNPVTQNDL